MEEIKCKPIKLFKFEDEGDTEKVIVNGMEFLIFFWRHAKPPFYTAHVITKDTPFSLLNIEPITPRNEFSTREEAIEAIKEFARRFGYRKDITTSDIKTEAKIRALEKISTFKVKK